MLPRSSKPRLFPEGLKNYGQIKANGKKKPHKPYQAETTQRREERAVIPPLFLPPNLPLAARPAASRLNPCPAPNPARVLARSPAGGCPWPAGRGGAGCGRSGAAAPVPPPVQPVPVPSHAGAAARPAGRLGAAAAAAAMAAAPGALEEGGGGAGAAGAQPGADGGGGAALSGAGERRARSIPRGHRTWAPSPSPAPGIPHLGPFPIACPGGSSPEPLPHRLLRRFRIWDPSPSPAPCCPPSLRGAAARPPGRCSAGSLYGPMGI